MNGTHFSNFSLLLNLENLPKNWQFDLRAPWTWCSKCCFSWLVSMCMLLYVVQSCVVDRFVFEYISGDFDHICLKIEHRRFSLTTYIDQKSVCKLLVRLNIFWLSLKVVQASSIVLLLSKVSKWWKKHDNSISVMLFVVWSMQFVWICIIPW